MISIQIYDKRIYGSSCLSQNFVNVTNFNFASLLKMGWLEYILSDLEFSNYNYDAFGWYSFLILVIIV